MENSFVFTSESIKHHWVVPVDGFVAELFVRGNSGMCPISPLGGFLVLFPADGDFARCLSDVFLTAWTIITVNTLLLFLVLFWGALGGKYVS